MKTVEDISLVQTCGACPEQYDAFCDGVQVGYLRLRHGYFRVDYPDHGGETIYEANPKGDGIFDDDERQFYLLEARKAILRKVTGTESPESLSSEMLDILKEFVNIFDSADYVELYGLRERAQEVIRKIEH